LESRQRNGVLGCLAANCALGRMGIVAPCAGAMTNNRSPMQFLSDRDRRIFLMSRMLSKALSG